MVHSIKNKYQNLLTIYFVVFVLALTIFKILTFQTCDLEKVDYSHGEQVSLRNTHVTKFKIPHLSFTPPHLSLISPSPLPHLIL